MGPLVRQVLVVSALVVAAAAAPSSALAAACPAVVTPAQLMSQAQLRALNDQEWRLGPRPTASPAQTKFINLLERRMRVLPGMRTRSVRYSIHRWQERSTTLRLGGADVPVAGAVPYSRATGTIGITAPLAEVPRDQGITAANAAGRIVVRDATPAQVPLAVFFPGVLGRSVFDPGATLSRDAPFQRDFLSYDARMKDLRDAQAAGAAGVLFLMDLPREQVAGHYAPYEGVHWGVPGAYLGADEGARVRAALADGGAPAATLAVDATTRAATTRMVLATLPGMSRQRLVVESHTDGANAVWDNGPVAMIAMAQYLARLPRTCRPRTVEFAFTTGHLYQRLRGTSVRDGSAELLAEQLDRDYDRGTVAGVIAVEHLGARQYEPVARADGGPGHVLQQTGLPELTLVGVTDSTPLVRAVSAVVRRHDLRRTALIEGADLAGAHVPPHCTLGGEGTSYDKHLLPTVGVIAAPATLYDPSFGLEGIDFGEMRAQMLALTDLTLALGRLDRAAIAGKITQYRAQRRQGAAGCPEHA